MKITDLRATTVTVPIEAPLRHANGCHWGRFVRTIVEVETDEGLIGLGEMGGGGESAEAAFKALKSYVVGHDPARVEELRFCETFQLGVAVHSSGELGIQLATMLHLGAVIPNLSFAAAAHYHHLTSSPAAS